MRAADLRGHLEHQEDLQAFHVNAAIQQLHGLVEVVLSGQRNHQLQDENTTSVFISILLNIRFKSRCRPVKSHLVVGVVKVHRLTESHLSFRLQVVQLDGSRELQDPAEEERGQRSGGNIRGLH